MIFKDLSKTYCNPLPIPNIPRGYDEYMTAQKNMIDDIITAQEEKGEHRAISDPTVMFYDNKWYLYASYGMAWVSEDFKNWKHVKTKPYCPKYSPCITKWKDKFLLTSWNCPLYVSHSPTGPFEMLGDFVLPDGKHFVPCDPALFTDDDGRIYLYAFASEPMDGRVDFCTKIIGYELNSRNPREVICGPFDLLKMDPENHSWERYGFDNQDTLFGWVEGPHMLKHNGRYYMIYGTPCTNNGAYCLAVYYSDSPLKNFVCQKRNPLAINRFGIVSGTGHGCVEHGPDNTLWAFYTVFAGVAHTYERRIGMDLVDVDENGELYCPHGITETPQYIPGYSQNPTRDNSPHLFALNRFYRSASSSSKPGRDAIYATDASSITWWEPQENDETPTLTCYLKARYFVGAVRLFWQERGLCYEKGIVPQKVEYMLEGRNGEEWFLLYDNIGETEEMNIDYKTFMPRSCDEVRLTILKMPKGINIGVRDFTVFGVRDLCK